MDRLAHIETRSPNWLPIPGGGVQKSATAPAVEENDFFPKGTVASYFSHQGFGTIKNDRGEAINFRLAEVSLIGPKGDKRFLGTGLRVGYDVSWTSHGLHVSRIKIY
jgi:cold shock CspA family protein